MQVDAVRRGPGRPRKAAAPEAPKRTIHDFLGQVDTMTAHEVAEVLRMTPKAIYCKARAAQLPVCDTGYPVRFRTIDIAKIVLGDNLSKAL